MQISYITVKTCYKIKIGIENYGPVFMVFRGYNVTLN